MPEPTCPRCGCVLIGLEADEHPTCPDPRAHDRVPSSHVPARAQRFGGQSPRRSWPVTPDGYVKLAFQNYRGDEREYDVILDFVHPRTRQTLPYAFRKRVLDKTDILFISGLGKAAFEAISSALPGRTAGHRVRVDSLVFASEYLFSSGAWRRRTRKQLKARHHEGCRLGCRKQHKDRR
jgi:hypothetical protein